MTTAYPRLLLVLGLAAVGGIALLGWKMAGVPPVEVARTSRKPLTLKPPRAPAPRFVPPSRSSETAASWPLKPEGPLARLFANPNQAFRLSPTQLQAYLATHNRNAESLLAALRLTGEMAFLQEAARHFPADPMVQLELALRSEVPDERRQALEALRQADPDNGLADHLSALEHLRQGNPEAAFVDLAAASAKSRLDAYATAAIQSSEEAYLAAGFTPLEAKAAALFGLPVREAQPLTELTKHLAALQKSYAEAGDAESAEAVRQMGHALGQQLQSEALFFIHELIGISMEKNFLDPVVAAARQQELRERTDYLRSLTNHPRWQGLMQQGSPADLSLFLDRQKLYGEEAAIRWWIDR